VNPRELQKHFKTFLYLFSAPDKRWATILKNGSVKAKPIHRFFEGKSNKAIQPAQHKQVFFDEAITAKKVLKAPWYQEPRSF
jgi:hypothetical protein